MSSPTPLQSFLGGLGLAVPVYALLRLNGSVFGISGFLHRAMLGGKEAIAAVAGIVSGGMLVGIVEGGVNAFTIGFHQVILSGFLVGLGSKLSQGCTSGHMIAGVSRFSRRSIAATAAFFTTAVITAQMLHRGLPSTSNADWTLGKHGETLLAFQAIPLTISTLLYFFHPPPQPLPPLVAAAPVTKPRSSLRRLAIFSAGFEFALSLRLSNLSDPTRVLSFLLLPMHRSFDPSLAFLAVGAMPLSIVLYHFYRGPEKPRLGGLWAVPEGSQIDSKLIIGAGLFGIGWGMSGVCPGPGLVNVGRALSGGSGLSQIASWLGAMVIGGLLV